MLSVNFIQLLPVIFNKTGTLPFQRNVLAIMANFDLTVMISLKSQNNFKHAEQTNIGSIKVTSKAIQPFEEKSPKCMQAISSEPPIEISHQVAFVPTMYACMIQTILPAACIVTSTYVPLLYLWK